MNQNVLKALEPLKMSLQVAKIEGSSFVHIGDYIKDMNELKEVIKDLYERVNKLEDPHHKD